MSATARFTFTDVSADPTVETRAAISAADLAETQALGFEDLGYVAASAGLVLITRVQRSPDGKSYISLSTASGRSHAGRVTLLADGTIISTERKSPGLFSKIVAHGLRIPPRHRYYLELSDQQSVEGLSNAHDARVAKIRREQNSEPVPIASMAVVLGVRKRYRQIADPRMERQEQIAKTSAFVGLLLSLGVVVFFRARQGNPPGDGELHAIGRMLGVVAGATALAMVVCAVAFGVGLTLIGPLFAGAAAAPPPSPADALIKLGESVPSGPIPVGNANPEVGKADLSGIDPSELAQWMRTDMMICVGSACVPAVGLLLMVGFFGVDAVFLALGLDWFVNGLLVLTLRRGRLQLLRDKLVPRLVVAEASVPGASCPFPQRGMAGLNVAMGVVMMGVSVRNLMATSHKPPPPWFWFAILAAVAFVAVKVANATRSRHEKLRAA